MSDKKFDVSNPDLKARMQAMHYKESKELEDEICEEIANNTTFLSIVEPIPDCDGDEPKYDFPVLTTSGHGYIYYPIFTDMEELRKWNNDENAQILMLTFDHYADLMEQNSKANGLVVNPYGENFTIEREMVDYMKTKKAFFGKLAIEQMFHQEQEKSSIQLSDPTPYPTEMVDALSNCLAALPDVRKAWLRFMDNEGENSYLLILDTDVSMDELYEVSSAAMPYLHDNLYLDMLPLSEKFSKNAVEGVSPFYTKA